MQRTHTRALQAELTERRGIFLQRKSVLTTIVRGRRSLFNGLCFQLHIDTTMCYNRYDSFKRVISCQ